VYNLQIKGSAMGKKLTLDSVIEEFNAIDSARASVVRQDLGTLLVTLEPALAFNLMLSFGKTAEQREVMATPFGMDFMLTLRNQVLQQPDVPVLFEQTYGHRRPLVKLEGALSLYCYASDPGAPKEGAPVASFALETLREGLAVQPAAWAFNFVARREGILMGIPELADIGAAVAQRALPQTRSEAKRERIRSAYLAFTSYGTPVIRNAPVT
jgi:hypothetical protein